MTTRLQRQPTGGPRTRAILIAIVGGTAAAGIILAGDQWRSSARDADQSWSIVHGRSVPATPRPSSTRIVAVRTARQFAGAYLSYEVGRRGWQTLSALATPRLAAELRTTPVRLPRDGRRPTRGRLGALRPSRAGRGRWQVEVSIWRSGESSGLTLTLVPHRRRWVVSGVA
jgi:hypothetical protein